LAFREQDQNFLNINQKAMKHVKIISASLLAVAMLGTGCLKDKGYDNNEYGINDANNSPAGIGFHKGVQFRVGLGLELTADPQTINNQAVIMLMGAVPSRDVTVTIAIDPTIVSDYNTQNGTNIINMVEGVDFSIPGTTFTIPAGSRQVNVPISVPSTASFSSNDTYGIGVKIVSADAGYVLSSNQNRLLLAINLKNRWDGIYNLRGYHNRVPFTFPYEVEMHMETYGPTSDIFYWPDVGTYGHPIGVGPNNSLSWYGTAVQPVVVFDPATDLVTDVYGVGAGGPPITMLTGAGVGVSRYDATTKTIYVNWNYNNNPLRAFFDTLTFIRPR